MRHFFAFVALLVFAVYGCETTPKAAFQNEKQETTFDAKFTIAMGSCNKQHLPQEYWSVIEKDEADLFIWGGDNIYADTKDMQLMQEKYDMQKSNLHYQSFVSSLPYGLVGVWDDHDYGKNDAGKEWKYKEESKQLFMDFLDLDSAHPMANRQGTYYAEKLKVGKHSIALYMLDTRYFRDGLKVADSTNKRYQAHATPDSTLLGKAQWKWLDREFAASKADFNIIVSSIQFLSQEHGFETWGNFPFELKKMEDLMVKHQLKNVLILSGDRHISEFSQKEVAGLGYPLTDFTSSGLTHAYTSFSGEPNPYRVGEVTSQTSYGVVELNLDSYSALLQIKSTENGELLNELQIQF